ncbi:MAG: hypothetical protein JO223_09925 [Hyphomicrobiales bacterium]|nr:hypothetical protein [Hyphomicrobiales bacterium]
MVGRSVVVRVPLGHTTNWVQPSATDSTFSPPRSTRHAKILIDPESAATTRDAVAGARSNPAREPALAIL